MVKSMTGFGTGEYQDENYKISVEIKSVNHRYGDVTVHLPKILNALEDNLRKLIAKRLFRGKIDVFISLDEHIPRNKKIKVDKDLVIAYYEVLKEISQVLSLPASVSVQQIAEYPNVLSLEEEMLDVGVFKETVLGATAAALAQLLQMRAAEGKHIDEDLTARINILENYVDAIEQRLPQVVADYRKRLSSKLSELLGDSSLDEMRILQEVLIFSDRVNVTEEIVRLRSHVKQFRMAMENEEHAIGRKLDFIIQEMNRETNTIAAKANDAQIAGIVVEIKSEIEKIREQVQNVE